MIADGWREIRGQTPHFPGKVRHNWFKKVFQFFRIGGHRFVLNLPREITVEVSMNRRGVPRHRHEPHYTVR